MKEAYIAAKERWARKLSGQAKPTVRSHDRLPPGEWVMTQELLASLLGVRRESITQAAGRLQGLGHISYRRGHISVLNAAGLGACACECHGVVKSEMLRLSAPRQRPR